LGVNAGDPLSLRTNIAFESQASLMPIVIEHASADPIYRDNTDPRLYKLETFISVPLFLADARYFGNLCAFDPRLTPVGAPHILSMFKRFAALIVSELENDWLRELEQRALLEERAARESRETLIAVLGHDLRNPLHAVLACNDMLQRKLTDPQLVLLTTRVKSHLSRMFALIDDVLDFARGRLGGGIGVELTEVQKISTGLSRVVQELEDAHPDCKIISNIRVHRSVRCDLGRLQQLASNLLTNALTHGRSKAPVEFTAYADQEDLILQVWNAGDPIPKENMEKIFEPFWRPAASTRRNGLGLGLYICSEIVRAHHGRLEVESTAALGTLFTARLPLGPSRISGRSTAQIPPDKTSPRVPATTSIAMHAAP
jgi:signal transduction histidine kinase